MNDKTPLRPEHEFVIISPSTQDDGAYLVYWDDILDVEACLKMAFDDDADSSFEVADFAGYFYDVAHRSKRHWWGKMPEVTLTRRSSPDPRRLRFLINECFDRARQPPVETLTESELFEIVRSHHPVRRKK